MTSAFYIEPISSKKRWFQRWWGKVLIFLGGVFCLFLFVVVVTTARYWLQIKKGEQPTIPGREGAFTSSLSRSGSILASNRAKLEQVDNPYLGRPTAPTVVVAFMDYKCPNSKASASILKQVAEKYGYTAKIMIRDFPAESIHPGATDLSYMARCAEKQGRFWEMYNFLFSHQNELPYPLSEDDKRTIATETGVNYAELAACVQGTAVQDAVRKDYLEGVGFGVAGTPTFFVNGQKVEGTVSFDAWRQYFETVLKK